MYEFERPAHVVYPDAGDLRSDRIRQLYEYWLSKCRDGRLPSRNDIEPGDIRALLPHLILAELSQDPVRVFYRLVGTAVARRHRHDFTGRHHDQVESLSGSGLDQAYRRAQQTAAPVFGRAGLDTGDHSWIAFEYAVLPLSDDGKTVNKCLAIECAGEMERTAAPELINPDRAASAE